MTRTARTIATLAVLAGLALTGCASNDEPLEVTTPTPTATVTESGSADDVQTDAPEPEPAAPTVGDTVAAADVDAARDAGLAVFVAPNGDGSGVVVEPGYNLPQSVIDAGDAMSTDSTAPLGAPAPATADFNAMARAMDDASIGAFVVTFGVDFVNGVPQPDGYRVTALGIAGDVVVKDAPRFDRLEDAIANAEAQAAAVGAHVFVQV